MRPTLVALLLTAALACTAHHPQPVTAVELEQTKQAAAPIQAMALDLYAHLRAREGNLFLSPFSIADALSMTATGARGETATQFQSLLQADPAAYGAWAKELNAPHDTYELHTASALWAQNGHPFQAAYVKQLKTTFDAEPHAADFQHAAAAAVADVNRWVDHQTKGKINHVVDQFDPLTKLVLANAIYFKGTWQHTFRKEATQDAPFHAAGGKDVTVPMMRLGATSFAYADDAATQIVELPYKGDEVSMVVVLPKRIDGLNELEKGLTADKLSGWLGKLQRQQVLLELPRFKLEQTLDLVPPLKEGGLTDAFAPGKADFSGIDGTRELYVSQVVHAAFLSVDEQGTEAAAATIVGVGAMAMPVQHQPVPFRADHPFLFLIRHNRTGGILFIGRLVTPQP